MQTSVYSQDYPQGLKDVGSIAQILNSQKPTNVDLSGALEKARSIDVRFNGFEHRGLERELLSLLDIHGSRSGDMPYRISQYQLAVVVSNFAFLDDKNVEDPMEMLRSYPYLATRDMEEAAERLGNLGFRDSVGLLMRQCELANARYLDGVQKKLDYYVAYGISIQQLERDSELLLLDFDKIISPRLQYASIKAMEEYGVDGGMELGISPKDALDGDDDDFVEMLRHHGLSADIFEFKEFVEKPHTSFPMDMGLLRRNGVGIIFDGNKLICRPAMIHPTQVDDAASYNRSQRNGFNAKEFGQIEIVARVLTRKRLLHALAVDAILSAKELDHVFSRNSNGERDEARMMLLHGLGMLEELDSTNQRYMLGCSLFVIASNFAYLRMAGFDDAAEQLSTHRYLARYDIKKAVERLDSVGFKSSLEMLLKHWRLAAISESTLRKKIDYLNRYHIQLDYLEKHSVVFTYSLRGRMIPRFAYMHIAMAKSTDGKANTVKLKLDPEYLLRVRDDKFIDLLKRRNFDVDAAEYRAFVTTCTQDELANAPTPQHGTMMVFEDGLWKLEPVRDNGGSMRDLLRNDKG